MGSKQLKLVAIIYKKTESEKNGVDERYILVFQQHENIVKMRIDADDFSKDDWNMGQYYRVSTPDKDDVVKSKQENLDAVLYK